MRSWTLQVAVVGALTTAFMSVEAAAEPREPAEAGGRAAGVPSEAVPRIVSGSAARDADGVRGRIHVVSIGDTLWDIASLYHRTPWVWPSIWRENRDIANPHRIYPGDHLWISEAAMRRVTPEEAAEMVAAEQLAAAPHPDPGVGEVLPVPVAPVEEVLEKFSISGAATMDFLTEERLAAATSIVSSKSPRTWLLEGDRVVLGLGEGETRPGARYDVFRDAVPVRDFETGEVLGFHVEILGWVEVTEVHGDSSTAMIRTSTSEMERGDRLIQRTPPRAEFALTEAPAGIEAHIVFTPTRRTMIQQLDLVYLSRGALHGLEVGAQLEVFERGFVAPDSVRNRQVRTPDRRVAELVIVDTQPTTSVGFVVRAERELEVGDTVRPQTARVAMH